MNPRKQIRSLPQLQFSIGIRGQFEDIDLFKDTVMHSIKYFQDIDKHIMYIQATILKLKSESHFMPDPESDEYQDNLEISWEIDSLREDLDLLKSMKSREVVWVYQHSYVHVNDIIIDEKEFKFISYGMRYLSREYNNFLKENQWIPGTTTEQLNEGYIVLTVVANSGNHKFTLTKVTK